MPIRWAMEQMRKWILGILFVAVTTNSLSQHKVYKAPNDIGLKTSFQVSPVVSTPQWEEETSNSIQITPDADRALSSEEDEVRPSLDLRRTPSSQLGEQSGEYGGASRLMIDSEWEIIWKEKEEGAVIKPRYWKYQ